MQPRENGLWPVLGKDMTLAGAGLPRVQRCMTVKALVDANILVYAHDRAAGAKHDRTSTR